MIIFDLDGTLANCEHRRHFLDPGNYPNLCEYSNYRIVKGKPIIDLEGKASWRYKDTGEPFKHGWKSFYEACDKDEPFFQVFQALHSFKKNDFKIEIWSGRCESTREKTQSWFKESVLLFNMQYSYIQNIPIKMRPIGDNTPDDELKERWLDEYISSMWPSLPPVTAENEGKIFYRKDPISIVFDSNPKSIAMWRRRGIFVFNVNQSEEEF